MIDKQTKILPWTNYLNDQVLARKTRNTYLEYIGNLLSNDFPIIFEIYHLSLLLGIDTYTLSNMITFPQKYYRTFDIPKRKEGHRTISSPYPSLLHIQRWINKNILDRINVDKSSHGYTKNRSIITNAQQHLDSKALLKIDIQDFFPSIKINRVIEIFLRCGYPHNISYYLASLCCLNSSLPQGGATSPTISNIVLKKTDRRLNGLARKWNLTYTRYADDIVFSGDYIPPTFSSFVTQIINDNGFDVNRSKTTLITKKRKKIVTGISVATSKMCLPREKKREWRKEIYYLIKFGYHEHTKKIKVRDPIYLERMLGRLSFWKQVEPDNKFVLESIDRINELRAKLDNIIE